MQVPYDTATIKIKNFHSQEKNISFIHKFYLINTSKAIRLQFKAKLKSNKSHSTRKNRTSLLLSQ